MKISVAVNGYRVQYSGDAVEYAKQYASTHQNDWVEVRIDGKIVFKACENLNYRHEV